MVKAIDIHVHPWTREFMEKNDCIRYAIEFFRIPEELLPESIDDLISEMDKAGVQTSVTLGQGGLEEFQDSAHEPISTKNLQHRSKNGVRKTGRKKLSRFLFPLPIFSTSYLFENLYALVGATFSSTGGCS